MNKDEKIYTHYGLGNAEEKELNAAYSGDDGEKHAEIEPEIIKCVENSAKIETYCKYIIEVLQRCRKLIGAGENERAIIEYKFMIDNLKKEFSLL